MFGPGAAIRGIIKQNGCCIGIHCSECPLHDYCTFAAYGHGYYYMLVRYGVVGTPASTTATSSDDMILSFAKSWKANNGET